MKTLLISTALLAASTGFAAAEVTLSGDARMGIIGDFGGADVGFTSRARVTFNMTGSTDTGLEFGASFRADNAVDAAKGEAGSVYISGAFGKLSMGDVDHADLAAVGQVSGVGLTGLGDLNEIGHDSEDSDPAPHVLYEYSTNGATLYASVDMDDTYAIGAKYATDTYSIAIGYSKDGVDNDEEINVAASATFGAVTGKAKFQTYDGVGTATDSYALSLDYTSGPLVGTLYYSNIGGLLGAMEAYGVGVAYDLGGGAKVVGGYVNDVTFDDNAFDLGLSFSF